MAEARTYDARSVSVIVAGQYLTGFGEDMVEVEKSEDGYEVRVGAQGDPIRARVNDETGEIRVTLLPTSPQVPFLDRLANSGQLVSITVISRDPQERSSATQAYVTKPATRTYGKSAEDREYVFQCLDLKMT
ncbi:phage structural protein [Paenibacillus caseinilyticus]|uniref:phage structural protein n=1 Tax=Paenibacillus caseinilyticus TaxID=3098138 RepID=UPI0022B88AC7|nr:phage protein [Paenibacillus caseinilyticus]MCZ8518885.1 DUF3277 family protein [Paenibacillus caseinilyticus]